MRRAIELSSVGAQTGGGPFGAVVVKDGKIIGEGYCTVHGVESRCDSPRRGGSHQGRLQ